MAYKPSKQTGARLDEGDIEIADGKLLKGGGAGVNPTEIDESQL